jgi:hypothetical protein
MVTSCLERCLLLPDKRCEYFSPEYRDLRHGGPITYKAALDFLALGVKTVQFCTIATKFGYGILRDLESGTAFLMQEPGIRSMKELIGIAQPHPITDFMKLSPVKKISSFVVPLRALHFLRELCTLPVSCNRIG